MTNTYEAEDMLYSLRRGAAVIIHLGISHSRYQHGEAVIRTVYHSPNGGVDEAPSSRIFLGNARSQVITELWDKLFDAVLIARQYAVKHIVINLHREALRQWEKEFVTACIIVGYELKVPVAGVRLPYR